MPQLRGHIYGNQRNNILPHITVSVGIANLAGRSMSGHDLAVKAEAAKGHAKASGKNRIHVYVYEEAVN